MARGAGARTRERILDTAERMILGQGFAATSIDRIIEDVGITKGAFFYHFKTKGDLARSLIGRFAEQDARLMAANMARAEKLSSDTVQQVLIFVGLFLEVAESIEEAPPGCLFASYAYESGLFEQETLEVVAGALRRARQDLGDKLRAAAASHPLREEVDLDAVADMFTVVFEGAYVVARVLQEPAVFASQIRLYRSYLQHLFGVEPAAGASVA